MPGVPPLGLTPLARWHALAAAALLGGGAVGAVAPARAQTVVVDSGAVGVPPGLRRVRARLDALRGHIVVQPVIVRLPEAAPVVRRDTVGRQAPGAELPRDRARREPERPPPAPLPVPPVVQRDTVGRQAPAPRDPVWRMAPAPVPTVREVERVLLAEGLFRTSSVHFAFDRADLLVGSEGTLDTLGAVLQRLPALRLEVGGHTDYLGAEAYNQQLSERRAARVRAYLVERWDVAPERLVPVGYGEARPLSPDRGETGRALNRRVEFAVIGR